MGRGEGRSSPLESLVFAAGGVGCAGVDPGGGALQERLDPVAASVQRLLAPQAPPLPPQGLVEGAAAARGRAGVGAEAPEGRRRPTEPQRRGLSSAQSAAAEAGRGGQGAGRVGRFGLPGRPRPGPVMRPGDQRVTIGPPSVGPHPRAQCTVRRVSVSALPFAVPAASGSPAPRARGEKAPARRLA